MAVIKKGRIRDQYPNGVAMQPGFRLTEKNDGTIEGTVVFECDVADINNLPQQGSAHPVDNRCECYNREFEFIGLEKCRMTAAYFGITSNKTKEVVDHNPNADREPIETHPDFTELAGTKTSPKNGAKFDDETGEFLGFFDPEVTDLFGTRSYFTPATMVSLSYWQKSVPSLKKQMSIHASIPGFKKPDGVKDFLLLTTPYRQIGNFYQVTENYLGSGPKGWSTKIYP